MKTNEFKNFRDVLESEIVEVEAMNRLEAGACGGGCKKSCKGGSSKGKEPVKVQGKGDSNSWSTRDIYLNLPQSL